MVVSEQEGGRGEGLLGEDAEGRGEGDVLLARRLAGSRVMEGGTSKGRG